MEGSVGIKKEGWEGGTEIERDRRRVGDSVGVKKEGGVEGY